MTAIKRIHHVFVRMGLIWFNNLYPKKLQHWKTNVQTKGPSRRSASFARSITSKKCPSNTPRPQPILRWATAIQAPLPWASVPPVRQFPPQPAVQRWKPPGRVWPAGGENGRWVLKGIPWLGRKMGDNTSWRSTIPRDPGSPCQMMDHLVRWLDF